MTTQFINRTKMVATNTKTMDAVPYKDRFQIVYLLYFFLGVNHYLPWTFFITAHDYWMYKFRDTAFEDVDSNNRTDLQKDFSPATTIAIQCSMLIGYFLSLIFGHRLSIKMQVHGSLATILVLFVISTIFIHVNTDSWQTGFFVLVIIIVGLINGLTSIFGMGVMTMLTKFPYENFSSYIVGQGLGSIVTSTLQIISLAVGMSTTVSALVYFWLATLLIALTLLALFLIERTNKFYKHCDEQETDKKDTRMSFQEFVDTFKTIWPSLGIFFFFLCSLNPIHTAITSLVVSEGEGNGTWNDVYFVPVISFLLEGVCEYLGRMLAVRAIKLPIKGPWFVGFSALRVFIFVPLLLLCNAQPRKHLPVVFPHDYQYIIILIVYALTNGYLVTTGNLLIPKTIAPENLENAYHVNLVCAGILMATLSFLSFVSVEIL